jgi:hypothetical protein
MATKRKNVMRHLIEGVSEAQMAFLLDLDPPADANKFEVCDLQFPTIVHQRCRPLWLKHRTEILSQYIAAWPGMRPSWWFHFDPDCPRIESADIERYGWEDCYWLEHTPALRRRLGGIGSPDFECMGYVPHFWKAIPAHWLRPYDLDIADNGFLPDPLHPPEFEPEIEYLDRWGALLPGERKLASKSNPAAFLPVIVTPEDDGSTSIRLKKATNL